MKLSFLILSLAICYLVSSQFFGPIFGPEGEISGFEESVIKESFSEEELSFSSDGYTPLNITEASKDPQIKGFLYIGVQYVVQQGIQNDDIPNSFYQISEIYSIETQETEGVNYRFYVGLSDNKQNNVNITFVVNYQDGKTEVISYSFDEEWTDLDVFEAQSDPVIQGYLYSGIQYVVQQGISQGSLPNAFYQVNEIYNIATQDTPEGQNYKFEVELTDGQSNSNITFIVSYNNETKATKVIDYTIEDVLEEETETPIEEEEEVTETSPIGVYIPLDLSLASSDTKIQGLLYFGTQKVIQKGIENGTLPNSFYQIAKIYELANKTEGDLEYYKFDLQLADNQGNSADTTFEVSLQPGTNIREVTSYSFSNVTTNQTQQPPEQWENVDLNQASQDQTILQIGVFGINYIVQQGINSGTLPSSSYQPTVVYSLERQTQGNGINYRWNLEIADGLGNSAHIIFITFYDPTSTHLEVTDYQFVNVIRAF